MLRLARMGGSGAVFYLHRSYLASTHIFPIETTSDALSLQSRPTMLAFIRPTKEAAMPNGKLRAALEQYREDIREGNLNDDVRNVLAHLSLELLLAVSEAVEKNQARISAMEAAMKDLPERIVSALREEDKDARALKLDRRSKVYVALIAGGYTVLVALVAALA